MKLITRGDIKGPTIYQGMRDDFRKRIIEIKKPRRISVGPLVTLVFENRHTLLFPIEEMLRAESLHQEEQIAAEIEVYNALMPSDTSLSATLFIELPPEANARVELNRLVGLDEHVILHVGEHAIRADFEAGRSNDERISAVQYTRYPLSAAAKQALLEGGTAMAIEIDHPNYRHRTECPEATRSSLAADYQ